MPYYTTEHNGSNGENKYGEGVFFVVVVVFVVNDVRVNNSNFSWLALSTGFSAMAELRRN